MKKTFFQLVRYVAVGGAATAVDYGSYYFLTRGLSVGVLAANPLAYLAGNVVSFLGHRFITFRSEGKPLGEYVRFLLVTAIGLAVSQTVFVVLVWLGVHDLISKAAAVIVSGCFNYLANRFWTFRRP
jgi:putative flippase GtrA